MSFNRNQWQAYVHKVVNIWVPNKWETLQLCAREFFSSENLNLVIKFVYVTSIP